MEILFKIMGSKRKEKVRETKGELRIMTKVAGRKKRRTKIYIILILYR